MFIKVIFLDFDGVLNGDDGPPLFNEGWPLSHLETHLIEKINRIVETLDQQSKIKTKIVISSSWRVRFSLPEMIEMLQTKGLRVEIIDVTPRLLPKKMSLPVERGQEIKAWLQDVKEYQIDKFVILDDESDMNDLKKYLIKTNYKTGITDADVNKVIETLKD